ncbi:MAG: hypothetical protein LCH58_02780 [Bacteroidetes bacterium]|uniref:hypothetical protein n=1 Tax=Phnomibacter sp. TaxID=2836217 RepID=UPI002FDD59B1|nr:hypothetical protein [Bacteroidota bacterium]
MSATNTSTISAVQQLFELVKQLPQKEKQQLTDLLLEEHDSIEIPEAQKQFVRSSILQHKKHPELLLTEEKAWSMIDQNQPNESL